MKGIETIKLVVKQIYRWFMILTTLGLFIIVAYNVIRRYVFNNSIAWADELSRFMFIWVNLMGMISVFQNNELIGLDLFSNIIIKRVKHGKTVLYTIEMIVISVILAVLTFYSIEFLRTMGHVSATLGLPMKFVYSVLPFSMIAMLIGNIIKFTNVIRESRNN